MSAPNTSIIERDDSAYVSTQQTVNSFINAYAPCGPLGTNLVQSSKDFYKKYSVNNTYEAGLPVAFIEADALFNINSPVYFTRVIPEDALYGGAVVTVGNSSSGSHSLINGLANYESFSFASPTETTSTQVTNLTCKADVRGNLAGTYFYLPGQTQFVYLQRNASAEVTTITCNADVSKSLASTFFILPGYQYYVWFKVGGTGSDPAVSNILLSSLIGIEVDFTSNATATTIAGDISTAITTAHSAIFTTSANSGVLSITMATAGAVNTGNAGNTGFSYITSTKGLAASSAITIANKTGIQVLYNPGSSASTIASAINSALSANTIVTSALNGGDNTSLILTNINTGYFIDAAMGTNPANFIITTSVQGSNNYGSQALLFYTENPNSLPISITIASNQDNPTAAPIPYTFVVSTYIKGILETQITCSRKQSLKDGSGHLLYVEDAMKASSYVRCLDNLAIADTEIPTSITTALPLAGGSSGSNVTTGDMIDSIQPFYNTDLYDPTLLLVAGYTDEAYIAALDILASTRGDCVVINSVPYSVENSSNYLSDIISYRQNTLNLNSSYTATWSSNLSVYNSGLNKAVYVPSDGYVAGAIVNAAINYEIFYPILGFKRGTLNNVLDVLHRYTQDEMNALYDVQINPIRFIPGRGIVIWGQKTMQSQSSALDRLNARLLLISLKPMLKAFLENYIGELNNQTTSDKLVLSVDSVLSQFKTKGGLIDYKVSANPIDPTQPNTLTLNIALEITPAIEYIDCIITVKPTGVTFSI